tara:strand:+ start:747 stop:1220 length:474 start_codon:yes stop_codon:yes gene_type:complete
MKQTRIISAFPVCGKTHLFNNGYKDKIIIDSDSSKFSWLEDGTTRNPCFPQNYIEHIKENIGKVDYILVSSHIDVRRSLDENDLCWCFVVPDKSLMLEWVGRCYIRGNNEGFIKALISNWDNWTGNVGDPMPNGSSVLTSGEHLKDKMFFIETLTYN